MRFTQGAIEISDFAVAPTLGLDVYFAHPYSAREKGTIKSANGCVRWNLPKGTDFTPVSDEQVEEIEDLPHNQPMKCLGGMTPREAMYTALPLLAH